MISKFVLVLHLCSQLSGNCLDNQIIGQYDSHYICLQQGYLQSSHSLKSLDVDNINKNKLIVRFECKEFKQETT